MSGARTRERHRRAELKAILNRIEHAQTFEQRVAAVQEVDDFLRRVAASDREVWPYLGQIEERYPDDKYGEEDRLVVRALIADIVAPYLAGNASRAAASRHKRAWGPSAHGEEEPAGKKPH
jgi:hypothetical protein